MNATVNVQCRSWSGVYQLPNLTDLQQAAGMVFFIPVQKFKKCMNQPVSFSNESLLSKLYAMPLECNLEGAMQQRTALYHL